MDCGLPAHTYVHMLTYFMYVNFFQIDCFFLRFCSVCDVHTIQIKVGLYEFTLWSIFVIMLFPMIVVIDHNKYFYYYHSFTIVKIVILIIIIILIIILITIIDTSFFENSFYTDSHFFFFKYEKSEA